MWPELIKYNELRFSDPDKFEYILYIEMYKSLENEIKKLSESNKDYAKAKNQQIEAAFDRLASAIKIKNDGRLRYQQTQTNGELNLAQVPETDFQTFDSMLDFCIDTWEIDEAQGKFVQNFSLRQALSIAKPLWGKAAALRAVEANLAERQKERYGPVDIIISASDEVASVFRIPNCVPVMYERNWRLHGIFGGQSITIANKLFSNLSLYVASPRFSQEILKSYGMHLFRQRHEAGAKSGYSQYSRLFPGSQLKAITYSVSWLRSDDYDPTCPPMDGIIKQKHWMFSGNYHYTYHPGPLDAAWMMEANRRFYQCEKLWLEDLIVREADSGLSADQTKELEQLSATHRTLARQLREENLPIKTERVQKEARVRAEREAQEKQKAAQERQRALETRQAAERVSTQHRISNLNKKLHTFFNPENYARTTREIDKILREGAEIDSVDADGYTALMLAVDSNDEHDAEFLLESNADPLLTNKQGRRASDMAANDSSLYIMLKRYELKFAMGKGGSKPIVQSVFTSRHMDVRSEEFVNLSCNAEGDTALTLAARRNQTETVELLLSQGADPMVATKQGKTPYLLTTEPAIKQLLEAAMEEQEEMAARACAFSGGM